jgi:TrmH family RNA methyltransferase
MLSKSQIKLIHSLELKKYRQETGLFLVEGTKAVMEFISNRWEPYLILATEIWAQTTLPHGIKNLQLSTYDEIQKASFQKTPQEVVAVFEQKSYKENALNIKNGLGIALDEVQDAGNVGTIIRIALWFGFDYLVLGSGTADIYQPKVIQASMGALSKMPFLQVSLPVFLQTVSKSIPIYGTFLEGTSIYQSTLKPNGILVMGNEGNGISQKIEPFITQKLFIPPYPENSQPIDSLNVSTATAIIAAEFRRNQ